MSGNSSAAINNLVQVRGARQNNLRNLTVDIPRNVFAVFTGISGSGKSSLAFGTIYAEAQRRYFESVAPYARRLIEQLPAPKVGDILGLPPAVALQQRRGEPTVRSSVGTLTTLSNSLRMLFSRAGTYPDDLTERLDSDAFSANTQTGACPACHGIGLIHSVSEQSLVPDPNLTIREGAIAAWPGAWQGKNLRDILSVLGYDVDKPWKDLSDKDRHWILFTDEKPVVTVHAEREAHRIQRPYQGTYMSAAHYVMHTFANTKSETLRKRAAQFMTSTLCRECKGKRLNKKALSVRFADHDIAELSHLPLKELAALLRAHNQLPTKDKKKMREKSIEVARLIVDDLTHRIDMISKLGLDYLALDRSTPTLSAGELQRLRLSTQLRSGLFGVIYILDEPSAGLHPSDTEALYETLMNLQKAGNSLFVVEHDMYLVSKADWIVDVGPDAGDHGGTLIYSGPVAGLAQITASHTSRFLFRKKRAVDRSPRAAANWICLKGITRNNLNNLDVQLPLGVLTVVTGVSGSGKSTLISKVLADTVTKLLRSDDHSESVETEDLDEEDVDDGGTMTKPDLQAAEGLALIDRLVCVDQKPIGRTPRSNLATYTGLFDVIREKFASTKEAKTKKYNAGRFSFNVKGGRCDHCEGEGFTVVELLFLPSVYAPCPVCQGTRYNTDTLRIKYNGLNIAEVLDLTVEAASDFFADVPPVARALETLRRVGLGYLRIGQPATELSGGEAQRIKLATELQRAQRGHTLYLLDEPTTGLHPADVEKLMILLHSLVEANNTVIVVEHDLDVIVQADWIIDLGPGGGNQGGKIVAEGIPADVAGSAQSKTAVFLSQVLD